jgi:two-component system response regulator ResD
MSAARRETLLLVDDEVDLREALAMALRRAGYDVLEADDGVKAFALAERHPTPISLLITDFQMPGLDGLRLADRLSDRMKALVMSGLPVGDLKPRLYREDAVEFIEKPFTGRDLVAKVKGMLGDSQSAMLADPISAA